MSKRKYLGKHEAICPERANEDAFLDYLRKLDNEEWKELIEDLISENSGPDLIAVGRAEGMLLASYASTFDKLELPYRRLIGRVLDGIVNQHLSHPPSERNNQIIERSFKLSSLLRGGLSNNLLVHIIHNKELPARLRSRAASTLATYDIPMPESFWRELDVEKFPFLAPAIINAMGKSNPLSALETFLRVPAFPGNLVPFEYPSRLALRRILATDVGRGSVHSLVNNMPEWARQYFEKHIFNLAEFRSQRITVAEGRIENPVLKAADYNLNDLFDGGRPDERILTTPVDLIWDHQLIPFAEKMGFLGRLNIRLVDDGGYGFPDSHKKLFTKSEASALIAEPRKFITEDTTYAANSSDIAITNIFTGFALVGRANLGIQPLDHRKDRRDVFIDLMRYIYSNASVVSTLDRGGEKFFKLLQSLYETHDVGIEGGPAPFRRIPSKPGTDTLFEKLQSGQADFIIGAAPTVALALQAGYRIYVDSHDVENVIESFSEGVEDARDLWREIISDVHSPFIHNCWNINVSSKLWEGDVFKPLILRLASVAFYTIDYLKVNEGEVLKFIHERWNDAHQQSKLQVRPDTLKRIFNDSYQFKTFEENFESFFYVNAKYNYKMSILSGTPDSMKPENRRKLYNADNVFKELSALKQIYENSVRELNDRMSQRSISREATSQVQAIESYARKHADIRNYYDAVNYIQQANDLVKEAA